eukprot:3933896-Rhodomonas_salina.1
MRSGERGGSLRRESGGSLEGVWRGLRGSQKGVAKSSVKQVGDSATPRGGGVQCEERLAE